MIPVLRALVFACVFALVAGCVAYPAPYYAYPGPITYDRAWNAALGALDDVGVRLLSVDRDAGVARGSKDGIDVLLSVQRQADGTTRVQLDAPSSQRDPGLAQRFSSAYERRMGR